MRGQFYVCFWLSVAGLLLAPLPSPAATISNVAIVLNAGNSADYFDNAGAIASAVESTATLDSSSSSAFDTSYAAVVSADRGGSGGSGTTTQNFAGDFTITFDVTATAGSTWEIEFDVLRIGAQTIVSDGNGNAAVALGALTGGETGAGSLSSGSLNLAALATFSNAGIGGTPTVDAPFSQSTTAVLEGLGTGFAQSVILSFTFTASATTVDPPGGGTPQGDEAALRMGRDSGLSYFSADDYGGIGSRAIAGDGIFVRARSRSSPEPGTAALLGLGLGLLAFLRRRPTGSRGSA